MSLPRALVVRFSSRIGFGHPLSLTLNIFNVIFMCLEFELTLVFPHFSTLHFSPSSTLILLLQLDSLRIKKS
jgi:hypothetical protein